MRVLVLGLGNPILSDDRVGLLVARQVASRLRNLQPWQETSTDAARADQSLPLTVQATSDFGIITVTVDEECTGGLRLMERMVGFDYVILIDAIFPSSNPGTVHRLSIFDLPTQRTAGTHDMHVTTALHLGRLAGYQLPDDQHILVVGVEVSDVFTFGEFCGAPVTAACELAIDMVLACLEDLRTFGRFTSSLTDS